jgi:hypothetical protein
MYIKALRACAVATVFTSFRFQFNKRRKAAIKTRCPATEAHRHVNYKACNALATSKNDVSTALKWPQNDPAVSSTKNKKLPKLHRTAGEVLVGVSILSSGTSPS